MKANLIKNLIIKIETCLKDRAKSFAVKDITVEGASRSTVYRYVKKLREQNVLEKKGREKYTVTDKFRRRVVKEKRGFL